MFERLRNFIAGVGQLIRNPDLLKEYESALSTTDHYRKEAVRESDQLREAYGKINAELSFRKEMDGQGITVKQRYVDTELGVDHLLDRPWDGEKIQVSYIEVTGFSVNNGNRYIQTNLGAVEAHRFLERLEQGALVTMEQAQQESAQLQPVPGRAELVSRMSKAGFVPADRTGLVKGLLLWKETAEGKEFGLAGWQEVKEFVTNVEQGKVAGMLFYGGGEAIWFADADEYIEEYGKDLNERGPSGVFAKTITKDPAVRKAVDDLIYGEFGEENPHGLDYYEERLAASHEARSREIDFRQEGIGLEM